VAIEWCTQCRGAWMDLFQLDLILHRVRPRPDAEARTDKGSDTELPANAGSRRKK
jgi:Zn-finger nucleic acid-binding protein